MQRTLEGGEVEPEPEPKCFETGVGVWTIFENAVVYGDVRDAFSYWENKRGRKKKFGRFRGFVIGEVILGDCRLHYEFYKPDPRVEARRSLKRHLRRRKIPLWFYRKYMRKNKLTKWVKRVKHP